MVSVRAYLLVWAALIILTATTTGVAFIDLGAQWNTVVALAIAAGKTLLVVLYFMHLRYASRLTWVFAGAGLFWLLILVAGTMDDVLTRTAPNTARQTTAVEPRFPDESAIRSGGSLERAVKPARAREAGMNAKTVSGPAGRSDPPPG
jgi:cytochrome c oxidase subunit 4